MKSFPQRSYHDVRETLLAKREIALLDVREEDPHAQCHPLFAANLPLSKIELEAWTRLPRRDVPIVVLDHGEGFAQRAAERLASLGYTDVALLEGGLDGWIHDGGEVFRDVNVPSKAFGEFVEAQRHTPSLSAEAVNALLQNGDDVVVLDARRFDEYATMNIPGSVSVPGAELVLRARALAPDPSTRVIVNCAGRTRSIIGTQSLVNAGLPNPVAALRNGTIGWTLAGQTLEHGSQRRFDPQAGRDTTNLHASRDAARALADRAGVGRTTLNEAASWALEAASAQRAARTIYRFDVRTPGEYEHAHAPGFQGAPGGQLVQETEMFAPVRGARIVLFDDDGVRANMTASWLAQMNIDVYVVDHATAASLTESGAWRAPTPAPSVATPTISTDTLAAWLDDSNSRTVLLDVTSSANHVKAHIPGAHWILRSRLTNAFDDLRALPDANRYVLTCGSSALARFAAPEVAALTGKPVHVLEGGNTAWVNAGLPVETGDARLASPRIDRYRRPYEGTDNAREAMNAYLEWEYGLVAQLERDGTHGFFAI
ncbi:rhodanese-related sulfurtransferase [Paraburkholderia sp.]|uniref:rhodanese-related sulfurtransferase n=1 Tax=Paraburkholderia sp. TaxID=1926495 RepID=UPI0023A578E8|nr:rhodanese-related sulfurtransferase [Paraburkholderia sp.]MDE1182397.1 rhodanese-related sulfurtransferase [Paraburkholderia sp.]